MAYHPKIDNFPAAQHPLVCKLLAVIFNERPPQPRYQLAWDVKLVLDYFENLNDDNSLLFDKDLTEKLTMLLALASAGRSSEIDAFDIRFMSLSDEVVVFHLSRLTKNRKQGSPPLEVSLRCFPHNSNLCVISCLKVYLQRVANRRKSNDETHKTQLLLGIVNPYVEVVSSTVACWLKNVDTTTFKPHSACSASTSKASAQGFSVKDILDRANWSRATTLLVPAFINISSSTMLPWQHF